MFTLPDVLFMFQHHGLNLCTVKIQYLYNNNNNVRMKKREIKILTIIIIRVHSIWLCPRSIYVKLYMDLLFLKQVLEPKIVFRFGFYKRFSFYF